MSENKGINHIQYFLTVYFYMLEKHLNNSENDLGKVKFQSEEANTDEHLKKYFQKYILENDSISKTELKSISIKNDNQSTTIKINELTSFKITNVFLPEELSKKQKEEITNSKKSVYTNPDLFLEISDGKNTYFESLDVKFHKVVV
jgi:hypothetical protein